MQGWMEFSRTIFAQFNVGVVYVQGTGAERSLTKARVWLTKAAKQGHKDAINNLKFLDQQEGIKTTSSSSNFTESFVKFQSSL